MRILVISPTGKLLGISQRFVKEGHAVVFVNTNRIGDGIVPNKSDDVTVDWPDFVITEQINSDYRSSFPHSAFLGASEFANAFTVDPSYSERVLKLSGIPMIETMWFYTYDDFQDYLMEDEANTQCRYIYNNGKKEYKQPRHATIDDLIGMINYYHRYPFSLKKHVVGYEISVGAFWDGIRFTVPHAIAKYKDMLYLERISANCFLKTKILDKLEGIFKKSDYRGYMVIDLIIDKNDAYAVDMNLSNELGCLQALLELKKDSITELLYSVAIGKTDVGKFHNGIVSAIAVNVKNERTGLPIFGLVEDNLKHIWLQSVHKDNGSYYYVKTNNPIMWVTAGAQNLQVSQLRLKKTLRNLRINNIDYNKHKPRYMFSDIKEWL